MGRAVLASLVLALLALAARPAAAQLDQSPRVAARLVAESGEIAPGGTVAVALEEVIRPGWHTYWINPGDAGLPSALQWQLPAGWKADAIAWPYPKRLAVGPVMDYGYEGTVWLLTAVTAPADARPGDVLTLKAQGSWLVCKEICIPEDAALILPLTVSAHPAAPYATLADQFAAARAKLPTASPWPVRFARGQSLDLFIAAPSLAVAHPREAAFFPLHQGWITGHAPQEMGFAADGLVLRMQPGKKQVSALDGVLELTSSDGSVQALNIHATPGAVPAARFTQATGMSLPLALAFALLGGLILNLMPCVLPVLAMKALAVASKAHADRGEAAREGFAYGVGAVLSFVVLGSAVALLRAGGEAVGWGFQLQEPLAVAGFALLIFAVGLNLSGVFEIAGGITGGDAFTRKGGALGAFFTGVLAVAVAAPCTAPFMAAALGFALTQGAVMALTVFGALGIGFAAPFVAVALSPALLRLLPKPGLWMLRFRQALAFPMYAAAAWLLWVLTQEAGPDGLVAALGAMIALSFAAWAWGASRTANSHWRHVGAASALIALLLGAFSYSVIGAAKPAAVSASSVAPAGIVSEPYSAARLAALRAQHRAVFVDATAAWCITCLVNEEVALSGAAVREAFAAHHVAYLVADWTSRDSEITALLSTHGRTGVPLYLYYAPGAGDAKVLPQILSENDVLGAITNP
ncbi:MAG: thioredoxin family protein [Pseudomonadota bacterium]|nr:thioredoxin family protein [Pseudomonadota bacterium]